MAKEKKSEQTPKKASQRNERRPQGRRDRFVDSFRWGFVDGDEKEFGSDDDSYSARSDEIQDENPDTRERKSAQKSKKKSRTFSGDRLGDKPKGNESRTVEKKNSKTEKKSPKKSAPSFSFFEDDEDDDLNLPSYGRTPVPTDDELPQSEPLKKSVRRERDYAEKESKAKEKSPKKNPAKKESAEKRNTAAPSTTTGRTQFDWKRPEPSRQDNDQRDSVPEHRPARPKKEQMVWDSEKREYVPLVVPEPAAKARKKNSSKKSTRVSDSPTSATKSNRGDSVTDPFIDDDSVGNSAKDSNSRKRVFADKPVSTKKSSSRTDRDFEEDSDRDYRKKETVQKKASDSSGDRRSDSKEKREPKHSRRDGKKAGPAKTTSGGPRFDDRKIDEAVQDEFRSGPVSETNESDSNLRKKRGRDRDRKRQLQQRADVPPMVESNVPDPADIESEAKGFAKLGVSETMLEALKMIRFLEPTPIQAGVFEQVKAGQDVMGQAQTGTGKTAAFSIPIIEGIEECPPGNDPVAMILVPTRELAVQVRDEAAKLAYGRDIRISACYGGKPIAKQIARLKDGVDILVGTPGRILDLMNRRALSLDALRWVVLDEADRMLDIGFRPDIEKILRKTPKERQTLLFSATLAPPVVKLAEKYMKSPEVLDFSNKGIAVDTIEQFYITVDQERKFDALVYLLNEQEPNQAIIFTRTKRGADRLARLLSKRFENLSAIHGDLSQGERDRVMGKFRNGKLRYLVATDVVGRGIDVSGISHIINYDIPAFCDDYVHRVGRTGRMGREGVAYTFVTVEEGTELTRIEMRIDKLLKRAELKGFETFAKPADLSNDPDDDSSPPPKPVFGKSARKIRRAL